MVHANGLKTFTERGIRKKCAIIKISLTQSLGAKNMGIESEKKWYCSNTPPVLSLRWKGSVHRSPHPELTPFSKHSVISEPKWIAYHVMLSLYRWRVYASRRWGSSQTLSSEECQCQPVQFFQQNARTKKYLGFHWKWGESDGSFGFFLRLTKKHQLILSAWLWSSQRDIPDLLCRQEVED